MFPIKDRISIQNEQIVCAYLDNVLIPDEQCQLIDSLFDDDYNIGSVDVSPYSLGKLIDWKRHQFFTPNLGCKI